MKSVEITGGDVPDINALKEGLFGDENDPRSSSYKRKLNRPKIRWFRICLFVLLPAILAVAAGFGMSLAGVQPWICAVTGVLLYLVYAAVNMKRAMICLVKIYQRYAPDSVRMKCRFEPSCSEYMILSLEKYGAVKGLIKGIGRLKRCNINGGGYDYP